jgi:hypothetical protein
MHVENVMALVIVAWIALVGFVVAVVVRIVRLVSLPLHLRWELYPVPHERHASYGGSFFEDLDWWKQRPSSSHPGALRAMVPEILLLRGVHKHNKKIGGGERGHAHKAIMVIADRVLCGDLNIPRESSLVLLDDIVASGRLKLYPTRNDFPVTLHDPCDLVRMMGIVEPQRRILRRIAPKFREMQPHGVNNFCCGGGSGFAIMPGHNFADWRIRVASRRKFRQVLEAFGNDLDPSHPKYVCAPCSNCKGALRDILRCYDATSKVGIHYGGVVELIVNAMVDVKPGFISFNEA